MIRHLAGFACLALLCIGCRRMETPVVHSRQDIPDAVSALEKSLEKHPDEKARLHAEIALLELRAGNHPGAAAHFEHYQAWLENAYTRSLTRLALSKIVNERVKRYDPHYLETWMLRLLAAACAWAEGDHERAAIETRRLSRDLRLEQDPFDAVRLAKAKQQFLAWSGSFFFLLGRDEEAFADWRLSYQMDSSTMPEPQRSLLLDGGGQREGRSLPLSSDPGLHQSWHTKRQSGQWILELAGQGPEKVEKRASVTMIGFLPIVHGMQGPGKSPDNEIVEKVFLGALGRRLVSVAYPVFESQTSTPSTPHASAASLNFDGLMLESWDAQKNRLIAQNLVRIALKAATIHGVGAELKKHIEGVWGDLLLNAATALAWETERADLRQIHYFPASITLRHTPGPATPAALEIRLSDTAWK